jgi:hypothetical protein
MMMAGAKISRPRFIFHERVILASQLIINNGSNNVPIAFRKTRANLRVGDCVTRELNLRLAHHRSYGIIVHKNSGPSPMELRIAVHDGDLAAVAFNMGNGK